MLYDYDTIYFLELFTIRARGSSKHLVMTNAKIGEVVITIKTPRKGSENGKSILRP